MSTPYTILLSWPSLCQKLSKLMEIWRSSNEINFNCFFETRCTYVSDLVSVIWFTVFTYDITAVTVVVYRLWMDHRIVPLRASEHTAVTFHCHVSRCLTWQSPGSTEILAPGARSAATHYDALSACYIFDGPHPSAPPPTPSVHTSFDELHF